ncbi:MAG: FHA domain-containing protein [Deltaproteobacteria bacterium]|nr:FHA domain-containing protein [Deltaproteobacteria bacterium]
MKLIIEDDEGRKTVVPVVRDEITIGRQDGNTIKLTERNVSRKHARLWKDTGSLVIEDLGSYNGVRVNGDKIAGPTPVKEGDLIEIGDYDLGIQGKFEASSAPPPSKPATPPVAKAAPPATSSPKITPVQPAPAPVAAAPAPAPAPAPMDGGGPVGGSGGATAIVNINKLMQSAPDIEARDLAKNEMPRLVGLAGPFRAKEFYLMRSVVKFGRTDENDIGIDHQSISRQHGKFQLEAEGWRVYDNKSANGIKLNGEEYAASSVKPGDTIELGHVKFRFCAPGEKFTPPPEKVEGAPAPSGGKPPPTTAELIAGASQKGPMAGSSQAAKKSGPPMGLIIGGVVGLVVIVGAVLALMKRGPDPQEAAYESAKAFAAKKQFLEAAEQLENAGDKAPANFKKKIAEEADGQQTSQQFDGAVAAGDGDKAKTLFEKCAAENSFYCGKVKEKEEAMKGAYAKQHLKKANEAKAANNMATCLSEANLVTSLDPNNSDASGLASACAPKEAAVEKPVVKEGPSQKERDAKATKLFNDGYAKSQAGDYPAALKDLKASLELKPSKEILGPALRAMGITEARSGNTAEAAKYFKQYLPMCDPAECQKIKELIQKFGG